MTRPRKICHLTSVHIPFDTRIFHKECRSLAEAGYDVHLVARHTSEETVHDVRIHPIPPRRSRIKRMLFSIWDVYRQARNVDASLYHFHDPELIPAGVLLKLSGKKVISDIHEDYPDYIRTKEYLPVLLRRPVAWMVGILERFTAGMFDAVIVVVPVIDERFRPLNSRTVMVHNYPFLKELDPVKTGGSGNGSADEIPQIAYIGNITRDRGIIEMVRAMELVNRIRPAKLVIGGEFAPPALRDEVQRLPGYIFVDYQGFLNREQVSAVLARSRAGLVVPLPYSHNMQGYMNKLFEYMSAGIPVVASDFPRWRPLVAENRCGLMVDSRNPQAIADAILNLLENPGEASEMGLRGRQAVERKYSWETEKAVLLDLYRSLLG